MSKITLFWMRRDLRLEDNTGLSEALKSDEEVLPLFIFDTNIIAELPKHDARLTFIHNQISRIHEELKVHNSSILVKTGDPIAIIKDLIKEYEIAKVYTNRDYEPYAKERDAKIKKYLNDNLIEFKDFKDQVIFEKGEILSGSGTTYKVFTPYSKAWLQKFYETNLNPESWPLKNNFFTSPPLPIPSLKDLGFETSPIPIPTLKVKKSLIKNYDSTRDFPAIEGTSRLGIHLRFGTISIRKLALFAEELNKIYLNELIWREFYMMILDENPRVVDQAFKPQYDKITWKNNKEEFQAWCEGKTGYPMVDAGMRQMNSTGYMHNRVRMVTASFLSKHLLIDWRWGEAYFAEKLLDYELSSNNGGWQWAAGTGTDAQPYFRIFNPESQMKKFDKNLEYVKKWIPEYGTDKYPDAIVEHKFARKRALEVYKKALDK
ncbi:cryptochrome/photolyase family protein [Anditalea andensis]|uniref:Deoxyribodipyrimidine photolyase n=1 Tax=Anditalea andensis TaxID=1048983 RepID=A0A074L343_9BACT|nr:deoxyribodipyrimidine photo-lyase [Anditalea andensis]KEO74925.1 deoxyribodipyrimidine photolyase [Anditalea andensis]